MSDKLGNKALTKETIGQIRDFSTLFLGVCGILLFSRCYEWGLLAFKHGTKLLDFSYIISGLLNDLRVSFIITIPLWIFFKGIEKATRDVNLSLKSLSYLITIIGLVNLILITYFSATLTLLGPEFWAYSWTEITNTVIASEWVTLSGFLLLLTVTATIYWISNTIIGQAQKNLTKPVGTILCAIGLLVFATRWLPGMAKDSNSNREDNKFAYFVSSTVNVNNFYNAQSSPIGTLEFPFLHAASEKDVLGPFFKDSSQPPNIVFLIVESLGGEFVGDSGQWGGFAPFLDSLAQKGLYWPNGISPSGRTFGVVPSLLGSLPPGRHGFMDLGPDYPNHQSLISLLNDNGYHTAFYSGYNTYFDKLNYFLEYQQIDYVLNKQTIEKQYNSTSPAEDQNYWGFSDKQMFNIVSGILDTAATSPRLEIYHTLQSHSPFNVPNAKAYQKKFNRRLQTLDISNSRKGAYKQYRDELTALLYTDDAIRNFIQSYRERREFKNTIFVITGDHWLIPVPQTNQISRYHVPLIIYSPLLKQSDQFQSVNTHANIVPSLTTFLNQNYNISIPDSVHWIGSVMDTARSFRNIHSIPMMRNKNQLTDYLQKSNYLSNGELFELKENLRLSSLQNPEVKTKIADKLSHLKTINNYAIANNKLYPGSTASKSSSKYKFIARYDTLFQRLDSTEPSVDEQFKLARRKAFDGEYGIARAIAKRLLMQHPKYHDVRLLLGRTYAWDGQYGQARTVFKEVLERDSTYYDTYNALFDVERWAGNPQKALDVINRGLTYHPEQKQFLEKKIRILVELNQKAEAAKLYEELQNQYPNSKKMQSLKQYISK